MSYSRWIDSKWYIFPSVEKKIEAWRAGDSFLCWLPSESYQDFLKKAESTLQHDDEYEEDFKELKEILEENMDDINGWFKKWKAGQD